MKINCWRNTVKHMLIVEWVYFVCINEKLSFPPSFWGMGCFAPTVPLSRNCTGQLVSLWFSESLHTALPSSTMYMEIRRRKTHSVSSNKSCQVFLGEILCICGLSICFQVASEQNLKLIVLIKPKTSPKTKVNIPS